MKWLPASSMRCQARKSSDPAASKGIYNNVALFSLLTDALHCRHGSPGIKANLKAIQGDLFLLEKYVLFVSPSPSLIEHSDINQVVLPYVGTNFNARTVDLKIKTISGLEYTFSSIKKKELEQIENYLKDKNLGFEHETVPDVDMSLDEDMGGDDDDDDESDGEAFYSLIAVPYLISF